MYTSVVGRTFLSEYNRRHSLQYSARDFFDKVLFEQVFNDKKYLFWAGNSPFVQGLGGEKKPFFDTQERSEKLGKLHEKIQRREIDASTALGFPASEEKEYATTSGLISDLAVPNDDDSIYLSWIGGMLGLGIKGGYCVLINDANITYATYEGWAHYRRFLNDPTASLPPYKLNTWNGQWLAYYLDDHRYRPGFNVVTLQQDKIFSAKQGELEIDTVTWSRLYFSLARSQALDSAIAYIYSLGSTNKTVGFLPFSFRSGRTLIATYQALFGGDEYKLANISEFDNWFGLNPKQAFELGSIGMHALRPQSLKAYFANDKQLKFHTVNAARNKGETDEAYTNRLSAAKDKMQESIIFYQTYKTWLIAMLSKNKTEISDYSREIAQALVRYRNGGRKNDRKNLLENDFFKTSKNDMLRALETIITDDSVDMEIVEQMNGLRNQLHFMSREDFTYFTLLLKFDYAYADRHFDNQ